MQFTVPEPIFRTAERLAHDRGFASVSDYVSELVQRDDATPFQGQTAVVEAALLAGLDNGPPTPLTRTDWDALARRFI